MERQDLSISFSDHYATRREFAEKATSFVATQVADLAKIPLPGFNATMIGYWDPPSEAENPELKDFDGRVDINRVMDPEFGSEWRCMISITATGQYDESPREAFRGQIHVFVIE